MSLKLSTLQPRDIEWCIKRLPKAVRELLWSRPDCFLAGGFIRSCIASEDVHDIDLFAPTKDVAHLVALQLANGTSVYTTENAFTVAVNDVVVQVIHRWTFASPEECVASFDFTIACAAIFRSKTASDMNGKHSWSSVCAADYYADLAGKRLVYLSPSRNEDAGGSILRAFKFAGRGYRIPLDSLGAVVARLMSGVDQKELAGRSSDESWVAQVVTGLLLEVDPLIALREIKEA